MPEKTKLLNRFLVLTVLLVFTFIAWQENSSAQEPTCLQQCEMNNYYCMSACDNAYSECVSYSPPWVVPVLCQPEYETCMGTCNSTYYSCSTNCTMPPPSGGGGGGGGGGRGRTACEQDCWEVKANCLQNGGSNCQENYNYCMSGCG